MIRQIICLQYDHLKQRRGSMVLERGGGAGVGHIGFGEKG